MIIRRLIIKNFGKIHNRTLELSPGINVLYGENESGKTTVHTFLKSMLYGMQRSRGRAAKTDVYSTYEPWENPVDYGGILWFENGNKRFRLTRNFHRMNVSEELLCEDDGELLDVSKGDLEAVLGGISEAVYENTVSVAQLKSVTGQDLVRELQNYMASYQGTGDSSVDLGRAMQMLKMCRKGYQVQADRQRREAEEAEAGLLSNMRYLQGELAELKEKRELAKQKAEKLHLSDKEDGEAYLERRIQRANKKKLLLRASMLVTAVAMVPVFILVNRLVEGWIPGGITALAGVLLLGLEFWSYGRWSAELDKTCRLKARWLAKQEKYQWNRESLDEAYEEKATDYSNLQAELKEAQSDGKLPLPEELEVDSLNLAMETIEELSRNIHARVGEGLRLRTSQILSEITGGKYTEVLMDPDFHMTVNTAERTVPLESLSRGTMEQIYFALRMAAGELLCKGENFPVILDDVFGMYDEDRLAAVLRWLYSQNRQVIISTCHRREMELLDREGLDYKLLAL